MERYDVAKYIIELRCLSDSRSVMTIKVHEQKEFGFIRKKNNNMTPVYTRLWIICGATIQVIGQQWAFDLWIRHLIKGCRTRPPIIGLYSGKRERGCVIISSFSNANNTFDDATTKQEQYYIATLNMYTMMLSWVICFVLHNLRPITEKWLWYTIKWFPKNMYRGNADILSVHLIVYRSVWNNKGLKIYNIMFFVVHFLVEW